MQTDNLVLTRGTGEYSHDFDPQLALASTDKVVIRIEEKVVARYLLMGVNDGGDGNEVIIDDATNIITMNLSEEIRNAIPDTGFTIKVFVNGEIAVFGSLTNSGTAAEGTTATPITVTNQDNTRTVTSDSTIKSDDDMIYGEPVEETTWTLTMGYTASSLYKKRYIIVNDGLGDIAVKDSDDNPIISVGPNSRVWIQSNGSKFVTVFTR